MYMLSVGVFVLDAPSYTSIISSSCTLRLFLPAFAMPFKMSSCGEQLMRYFLSSRVESRASMTALALPSAATRRALAFDPSSTHCASSFSPFSPVLSLRYLRSRLTTNFAPEDDEPEEAEEEEEEEEEEREEESAADDEDVSPDEPAKVKPLSPPAPPVLALAPPNENPVAAPAPTLMPTDGAKETDSAWEEEEELSLEDGAPANEKEEEEEEGSGAGEDEVKEEEEEEEEEEFGLGFPGDTTPCSLRNALMC